MSEDKRFLVRLL
ncbi:hypothetical protein VCHENC02_3974A, partial [Vibrio harveyi]